jgi:DNA polymerase-3 subunit chi
MTNVTFLELKIANKDRVICDVLEILYEQGQRTLVYAKDRKHTQLLNNLLWTWKQDSFIPHVLIEDRTEDPIEPVILTNTLPINVRADVLMLYDSLPADDLIAFPSVIDFAEIYHPEKLSQSRARYKMLRSDNRFNLEFTPLGVFLNNTTN